jgi:hypothetical protein
MYKQILKIFQKFELNKKTIAEFFLYIAIGWGIAHYLNCIV